MHLARGEGEEYCYAIFPLVTQKNIPLCIHTEWKLEISVACLLRLRLCLKMVRHAP